MLLEDLRGKIIRILSEDKIVINVGSNDKVKTGMVFEIYGEEGEVIKDPETKEILGTLKISKGKCVVATVLPKFSITTTIKREVNLYEPPGMDLFYRTIEEKWKINPSDITPLMKLPETTTVNIGDQVKLISS